MTPTLNVQRAKRALVTGITGELGSVLTEFLLSKSYDVHGIVRSLSSVLKYEYHHIYNNVTLHEGDMRNTQNIESIVREVQPDEIYNLASLSHVQESWNDPALILDINFLGLVRIIEAVRHCGLSSRIRILNAGSSEMFGQAEKLPINEATPIAPRTPYATSKASAFWTVQNNRSMHEFFVVTAILFNHEHPRRGKSFATYKMAQAAANVKLGLLEHVEMGDLNLIRDWGHADDGVRFMWMALQHEQPDDYIVATGNGHTSRDFITQAFKCLGIELRWEGEGIAEVGRNVANEDVLVRVNESLYIASGLSNRQIGDSAKARTILGWKSQKTFEDVVNEMTFAALKRELTASDVHL